jgi:hypothetical protein
VISHRDSVIPYLKTNQFRARLLAIQKTCPIVYRTKVLGRALLAARTDANSFWMRLSGNTEVAFPSETTTIAAAANLPTIDAATSTTYAAAAAAAAVAASVMSDLTTTATCSLPTAAAPAATSTTTPSTASAANVARQTRSNTRQKRQARP